MTIRISTGVRNAIGNSLGFAGAFNKGHIRIYSGSQPINADAAATGTLLGVVSLSSGAVTQETPASQNITITGSAGSINTVTVGTVNIIPDGAVTFDTDVTTTALKLVSEINRNGMFLASSVAGVVTVTARPGAGATLNGVAFATTTTTLTATVGAATLAGGVNSVNCLHLIESAPGVVSKPSTQLWSFNGVAVGTAGWFRFIGNVADAGSLITAAPYLCRMDGSIATSGADMNLSNISITIGAPSTIDTFSWTTPAV